MTIACKMAKLSEFFSLINSMWTYLHVQGPGENVWIVRDYLLTYKVMQEPNQSVQIVNVRMIETALYLLVSLFTFNGFRFAGLLLCIYSNLGNLFFKISII